MRYVCIDPLATSNLSGVIFRGENFRLEKFGKHTLELVVETYGSGRPKIYPVDIGIRGNEVLFYGT